MKTADALVAQLSPPTISTSRSTASSMWRQRQLRELVVRRFGRRKRQSRVAVVSPEPAYRRVNADELLLMHQWAATRGLSARAIGRKLRPPRDHHTVIAWLRPERQAAVAWRLYWGKRRLLAQAWLWRVPPGAERSALLEHFRVLDALETGNGAFIVESAELTVALLRRHPSPCAVTGGLAGATTARHQTPAQSRSTPRSAMTAEATGSQ